MFRLFVAKTHKFLQQSLIASLKGYRYFVSPLLGSRCRFYPSCSQYAMDALKHLGIVKGCLYIMFRILRCHPFHKGGYDPLIPPESKQAISHHIKK